MSSHLSRPTTLLDIGREPFRVFFPAGIVAGILGVALWPLHFSGLVEGYPGLAHARLVAQGFLGGFIFGFLGTAGPRLLSAPPLGTRNVLTLLTLHGVTIACWLTGRLVAGDVAFLTLLLLFVGLMGWRVLHRKDTPPPGFVLIGLALLCGVAGGVLAIWHHYQSEPATGGVFLQRLLSYQGFVLLPILGVGPFLLPRFFGLPSRHDFPEMEKPTSLWWRHAIRALTVGLLLIASFFVEAAGYYRLGHGLRFGVALAYLLVELPGLLAPRTSNALATSVRIGLAAVLIGFLAVTLFPPFRVALLHVTFTSGFALLTLAVATRVVFGHSGYSADFTARNRWLYVAVGMMLLAMATRVSGDFWPAILVSHYIYAAWGWIIAVLFWSGWVLPRLLQSELD